MQALRHASMAATSSQTEVDLVIKRLRRPKLWVTLANLLFLAVAVVHRYQLRDQSLDAAGWVGWFSGSVSVGSAS